jgi:hypothetical protein
MSVCTCKSCKKDGIKAVAHRAIYGYIPGANRFFQENPGEWQNSV